VNPGAGSPAGLARRLGASAYEGLLLGALLVLVGFALLALVSPPVEPDAMRIPGPAGTSKPLYLMSPAARHLSAIATFAACGAYCGSLWSGGRRSLPMKTWRLALSTAAGQPVGVPAAMVRYLACWAGPALAIGCYLALQPLGYGPWALLALAFNYAWALLDRDRQFFQDRVAGTRLMMDGRSRAGHASNGPGSYTHR
jgi:uncharacterized RDD family membrane protein YckC